MVFLPSALMNIFLGLGIFFPCPALVCQGQEGDSHIWEGRRFFFSSRGESWWSEGLTSLFVLSWAIYISHVDCSLIVHFVISIVAVPIPFLFSMLFPVNGSYLYLWSLPFLFLRGQGIGEALNWEVTFLNHDTSESTEIKILGSMIFKVKKVNKKNHI